MKVVYGDDCVDVSTVCRWAKISRDCELGRANFCDKQQHGRPATATDEFHKIKVDELRTINRSLKGKLLSSLAFHRNIWVTLLIFFNIGKFVQDGFLEC